MDRRGWKIVAGAAGAAVVFGGVGVAAAATDGFNLRDETEPAPVETGPPPAPDSTGEGATDTSPESADSPNESVTDTPVDPSPETPDSPNESPTDSPR